MNPNSQNAKILAYLKTVGPITPLIALSQFGCQRLAARIHDLTNKENVAILTVIKTDSNGTKYAEYSMVRGES